MELLVSTEMATAKTRVFSIKIPNQFCQMFGQKVYVFQST